MKLQKLVGNKKRKEKGYLEKFRKRIIEFKVY